MRKFKLFLVGGRAPSSFALSVARVTVAWAGGIRRGIMIPVTAVRPPRQPASPAPRRGRPNGPWRPSSPRYNLGVREGKCRLSPRHPAFAGPRFKFIAGPRKIMGISSCPFYCSETLPWGPGAGRRRHKSPAPATVTKAAPGGRASLEPCRRRPGDSDGVSGHSTTAVASPATNRREPRS